MKIAIIGYGKMGKEIEKVAKKRGHEIVSIIDVKNQIDFDSEAFKSADVAIEFTNPSVAYNNYLRAFEAGVKVVSGSTGWIAEHGDDIEKRCTKGGNTLFWSSNFSLGVAIFSAINRKLAKIMNQFPDYEVSLSETHHIHKLDAPSGTAITLAEEIIHSLDRKKSWVNNKPQSKDQLEIESIREGEVPGIHSITYDSAEDSISIIHNAKNRGGFALGAVIAAEFTVNHTGLLEMSDLFPFLYE
ncbi:MAG: 4-hydroxy-tetrahydrodipicolinate reductase [Bacteroides sp.]|nr:4-hydroxy-tetrahydrodipicolinate reductase [Bacteroides sp.]MDD2645203.1 4-hydroxy-tetrahydrodipicolinate reductase [Bacteroides sp.]MDD4054747.1 4-hydroxy-tetrahydrodipicolinate reductase [Bacteroides sp.]MDD4719766.1 4-hydroxy-tetrahydrodipicolinate reductase [Bacteroides sp.]NLI63406.1 4-hydroxy-tetrahydrodipicolinate reductase [Bacteroidales bacterium]